MWNIVLQKSCCRIIFSDRSASYANIKKDAKYILCKLFALQCLYLYCDNYGNGGNFAVTNILENIDS